MKAWAAGRQLKGRARMVGHDERDGVELTSLRQPGRGRGSLSSGQVTMASIDHCQSDMRLGNPWMARAAT